ncbi:MAG: carboxylesterase family protein [Ferruginibacter sp.]
MANWDGIPMADKFAPGAVQGINPASGKSKDCLYLNVWSPAKSANEKIPVLVWIYGGGFAVGHKLILIGSNEQQMAWFRFFIKFAPGNPFGLHFKNRGDLFICRDNFNLHGGTRDKLKPKGDELLPGNLHNNISLLTEELKGINPTIKNALHIRASVILHWLRQHNKRQVQYMAGHKDITSTEMYQVQEPETLTNQLNKHHPFG